MSAGSVSRCESFVESELGVRNRLWHIEAQGAKPRRGHRDQERLNGLPAARKIRESRLDQFTARKVGIAHVEILPPLHAHRHRQPPGGLILRTMTSTVSSSRNRAKSLPATPLLISEHVLLLFEIFEDLAFNGSQR